MSGLDLLLVTAVAQIPPAPAPAPAPAPMIRTRAPDQPVARATISDAQWIVGEWRGERDGQIAGEAYATLLPARSPACSTKPAPASWR